MIMTRRLLAVSLAVLCTTAPGWSEETPTEADKAATSPVSYYEQIRPLFQAKCQGCHQPAKAKGKYIMTMPTRGPYNSGPVD